MDKMTIGVVLSLLAQVVAAVSQILLKTAAGKQYGVWWRAYLNALVIIAYGLFFGTTLINAFAMRYVPMTLKAALGASSQIFVPVFSMLFLKERINAKQLKGMMLIVAGIVIFSLF